MTTPVAELRDVRVTYGGRVVLDVPHLAVLSGETLTVMGPNGSGKSTLLRVLALLERPAQGEVLHCGQRVAASLSGEALAHRRRLAVVMQQPFLRNTSAWENVATGLRFRHLPSSEMRRRVEEWLGRLGIAHLARQSARTLSGGEAQRASLARALALEPDLLLLDEPFAALDGPTRLSLLADLRAVLAQVRTTTFFVTHDRTEAQAMGDRLAVMLEGRIRQVGRPEEVFSMPASEEVAAFVGVENVLRGVVSQVADGLATVRVSEREVAVVGGFSAGDELVMGIRPEEVVLEPLPRGAALTSARNRLAGRVTGILPLGAQARVVVDCGFRVVSLVTRQSVLDLALTEGMPVLASFKASAVHVIRHSTGWAHAPPPGYT